jgi:hypothetical protein
MNALLQFEFLKLRTLRSTWVVAGAVAVLSAVVGATQVLVREPGVAPPDVARLLLGPAQAVWFLVIVLAVLASAGEFQHRTVRTSLLAVPRRHAGLAAKGVVAAAMGALLSTVGAVSCLVSGLATAVVSGTSLPMGSGDDYAAAAGAVALGALWAVLATGLGMLTRSTAIAITAVLIWRFVAEGMIPIVTRNPGLSRWTPSGAGDAIVGLGGSDALPAAAAAALLLGYTVAVCGTAALHFLRTDPV